MKGKRNSPRVTLAHVADSAGVSTATVSLVLSGREQWLKQFHPETIQKVRRSAERLGYRANLFASGLPTKQCMFFALVTRDIGRTDFSSSSWHLWAFEGDLLAGVMEAATERGLYPIIARADHFAEAEALAPIERIIDGGVLGAIVRSPNALFEQRLRLRLRRGFRVAIVFPNQPSKWKTNSISPDNVAMGEAAGRLLLGDKRREWAIIQYADRKPRESHLDRRKGFESVARQAGIPVRAIKTPREIENLSAQELRQLERLKVDGWFGVDSVLSINALRILTKSGREPGRDFGLVGVNCSRWQDFPLPRITSVDTSWKQVGMTAVRTLAGLVEGVECRFENILEQPHVIAGATCSVPRGSNSSGG